MKYLFLTVAALTAMTLPALAGGAPVPLPLAGAVGPVGLGVLALGYGAYRLVKMFR